MNSKRKSLLHISVAVFLFTSMVFATSARASQTWVECKPQRIGVYADRMHVTCGPTSPWYGIKFNNNNKDFANRIISIVNSAVISGKPMKILYDTVDGNDWRNILSVEVWQ